MVGRRLFYFKLEMLLIILFTVAVAHGSVLSSEVSENSICVKSPLEACDIGKGDKFPETAEDVDELCEDLVPFHYCISEFLRECDIDEDIIPFQEIFYSGVILTICNKDSSMYKVLIENVKCINDRLDLEESFCGNHIATLTEEAPDVLEQMQNLITGDTDEEKIQLQNCLESVFQVGCVATGLSKSCGQDAVHLYLYLADKSGMSENGCTEEHQSAIAELVELLQFEFKK